MSRGLGDVYKRQAFGLAESYFVFPDKTIEYIKGAQFDRQILEMTKNKIEKIYRLPEADVNRFAEVINEY